MASVLTCAKIARDVYRDSASTVDIFRPVDVTGGNIYTTGNDFYGAAYSGPGSVGIIAFRGSAELEDWACADVDIARDLWPVDQIGNAFGYFSAARKVLEISGSTRFIIVGHSLGGGLAAVVAARITRFAVRAVTFNAPGMAACRYCGTPEDDVSNKMFKSARDALDLARRGSPLTGLGAVVAATFQVGEKLVLKAAEAVVVDAKARIDLPLENRDNVFNFRGKLDPVSLAKGNHIGRVYTINNAGVHVIGPMIDRLKNVPEGSWQI